MKQSVLEREESRALLAVRHLKLCSPLCYSRLSIQLLIHEQEKRNYILPRLTGTREREHPTFLIQQSTQLWLLCSLPSHTLTATYLHRAIPKPHQQKQEERGQTKYHRKILVFHSKINVPCHFGKALLDFFFFFQVDGLIQALLRKWE